MTITGTVTRVDMGAGTWALSGDDGQTYELYGSKAEELKTEGQKVSVTGTIREDVMTIAMIGPVLEVESFEVVS